MVSISRKWFEWVYLINLLILPIVWFNLNFIIKKKKKKKKKRAKTTSF